MAVSEDAGIDAGKLVKAALAATGGRGGGTPRIAQGSIPNATLIDEILARLYVALVTRSPRCSNFQPCLVHPTRPSRRVPRIARRPPDATPSSIPLSCNTPNGRPLWPSDDGENEALRPVVVGVAFWIPAGASHNSLHSYTGPTALSWDRNSFR